MSTIEPSLADDLASAYAERDHWHRAAVGAEEVSAKTEAENAALRAELEALRARTAKIIAAEVAGDHRDPPMMSEEDWVWEVLQQVAGMTREDEPRLYIAVRNALTKADNARRLCKLLLDDAIDGRRR